MDLFRPCTGICSSGYAMQNSRGRRNIEEEGGVAWSVARQHTSAILAPGRRRQGHLEFRVSLEWSKSLGVTSQPMLSPRRFKS